MSNQNQMNVTGTGIAVAAAVIIALGLLFFSPEIVPLFTSKSTQATTATTTPMDDTQPASTGSEGALGASDMTPPTQTGASTGGNATSASNPFGLPANVTQLLMRDITVGTGATAAAGDSVTVNYVGMLTNGTVFDASANHGSTGFTFNLGAGQVIKGWDEGVAGMKVGGKRELVIPASLGYGAQSVGSIPANSTLVFEVELLNVTPGK